MTIHTRITEVTYCALPEESWDHSHFAVQVQWRGGVTYAVHRFKQVLGADGEWDYEPQPSSRTDEWIATHRFDYDTASRLAAEAAPSVIVNGATAAQIAEWEEANRRAS